MSILRKALGRPGAQDGCLEWIANIPLRGYRFLGRVHGEFVPVRCRDASSRTRRWGKRRPGCPLASPGSWRREAEVERLLGMLAASRLVTVAGPGGVGKTSVAICVAARYPERPPHAQVCFVDLAPLTSQDHVLTTMARAIGVRGDVPDIEEAMVRRLEGRATLLLVDNCEHVIERLSPLLGRFLAALPGLQVLATSREVLRVGGEHVFRLMPLAVEQSPPISLAHALRSPAVQLLIERAGGRGRARIRRREQRSVDPDLPAGGRHPTGDRVGRGPPGLTTRERAGIQARRSHAPAFDGRAGSCWQDNARWLRRWTGASACWAMPSCSCFAGCPCSVLTSASRRR